MKRVLLIVSFFPDLASGHGAELNSQGCDKKSTTSEHRCHRVSGKGLISAAGALTSAATANDNSNSFGAHYDRDSFELRPYIASDNLGVHTGQLWSEIDIERVVSLEEADDTEISHWTSEQKTVLTSERSNHVGTCSSVNRSKSSAPRMEFRIQSRDGGNLLACWICYYIFGSFCL